MKTNALIKASAIVQQYRLSYQTLNYYTNLGLLTVVKRNGNQRLYQGHDARRRLEAISRLKDEGYPLRLISRMLSRQMRKRRSQRNESWR